MQRASGQPTGYLSIWLENLGPHTAEPGGGGWGGWGAVAVPSPAASLLGRSPTVTPPAHQMLWLATPNRELSAMRCTSGPLPLPPKKLRQSAYATTVMVLAGRPAI